MLFRDDDPLPDVPSRSETALTAALGIDGLRQNDTCLLLHTRRTWRKVAMVIVKALDELKQPLVPEEPLDDLA